MNKLFTLIIIAGLIFIGFKIHLLLGIGVTAATIAITYIYNYPKLLLGRANAEFNQKNYDKAFALYEKAYKSNNRKYTVDIAYAQALLRTGNPQKALEIVNGILTLSHLKSEIKLPAKQTRILINYKLGDLDEAYTEAKEMFEDGYTTSNMYCLIGLLMIAKNEPIDETLEFCEKAYDYDSDNRDNVDNLLVCYIKTNNLEKAKPLADDLVENHPTFVEGWYHSAQVYEGLGEREKAIECLEKAKEADRTYLTTVSEEEIESLEAKLR